MKQLKLIFGIALCLLTIQLVSAQEDRERGMTSKSDQFDRLDQNNDGRISYYEFEQMTPPNKENEKEPRMENKPKKEPRLDRRDDDGSDGYGKGKNKNKEYKSKDKGGKSKDKVKDKDGKDKGYKGQGNRDKQDNGSRMDTKTLFNKMDANGNGYISWQEFNESKFQGKGKRFGGEQSHEDEDYDRDFDRSKKGGKSYSIIPDTRPIGFERFSSMDRNGNDKISYGEFKKSDMGKQAGSKKDCKALFNQLDRNDDGSITENEF